jgi:hypothetical protein
MNRASRDEELLGDEPFLVLNAIYLSKLASPDRAAEATGLDVSRVRTILAASEADGLVVDLGGQMMLSDEGRARVLAYYAERYAPCRAAGTVPDWYRRFETVNVQFIKLVTEWQQTGGDERVQERLVRLVERQVAALRELGAAIPRYTQYATRFENGLTKIDSGERDFVCKPTIDSVHNIWFEFHEDILAVMGQPRET